MRTRWVVELRNNVLVQGGIPTVLIGNKADLEREVSTEDGRALAEELQWSFFETSAKTGALVDEALDNIVASQSTAWLVLYVSQSGQRSSTRVSSGDWPERVRRLPGCRGRRSSASSPPPPCSSPSPSRSLAAADLLRRESREE